VRQLVSVVLPVFNAGPYLRSAVMSILDQTHRDLELIAIDDGSTDRSLEILEGIRRRDPRLIIVSRENQGLIATLNQGMLIARGEFVARMDADDISLPQRLELQLQRFQETPELALCGAYHYVIAGPNLVADPTVRVPSFTDRQISVISCFYAPFSHPSAVFNRRVLPPGDLRYDTEYPHAEDMELFGRIGRRYRVHAVPQRLLAIRRYGESVMTRHHRTMRHTHYRIVRENLLAFGVDARPLEALAQEGDGDDEVVVRNAARCLLEIRRRGEAVSDEADRRAYEVGYDNLLRHAFDTALERYGLSAARNLLSEAAAMGSLRRREVLLLKYGGWLPSRTWNALHSLDRLVYRNRCVPLHSILPGPDRPDGNTLSRTCRMERA
jgi:glycosyltransferase involved in cell wall biosynthesis